MSRPAHDLGELERLLAEVPSPPWLQIGWDVSKPEVDIVRWAYAEMPPAEWPDAHKHGDAIAALIAAGINALPDLIAAARALERIERGDTGLTGPAVEIARAALRPFYGGDKEPS